MTITPESRAKIVKWLYDCVDYLELQRECVAVAMSYVDRFMSSSNNNNDNNDNNNNENKNNNISRVSNKHSEVVAEAKRDASVYQLIGISALFLAAKQSDNRASADVDAEVLARVSHMSYSIDEILSMETTLLDALHWRLCAPTALGVAHHAIALLAKQDRRRDARGEERQRRRMDSVIDFARLQIELSASDYAISVLRRPSTTALAAVLNSVELLDFTAREKRSFGRSMSELAGMDVRSEEMEEARTELHRVFDRQSEDVMSRATLSSSKADKSVYTVKSSRSPVDARFATPRSSDRRRRKGSRPRKQKPSPTSVEPRCGKLKLEP